MWSLEGRGGRQVAAGHLIILIDITGTFFCSVLLWVASRSFYFRHKTSFCWLLVRVGEHVTLLITSHTTAVNPWMSPIFNFSFFFSLRSVENVFLFGLHCPVCIYFCGLLAQQRVWPRKRIVHRNFVSCTLTMWVIFITAVCVAFMFLLAVRLS